MINNLRVLALIPARGGSKGIKNKNIIKLAGKPLIYYSIHCGLKSKYIDDVVVSTDSEKIAKVAKKHGASVPFLRPDELASDTAKTIDAVLHAVATLKNQGREYDILVLLQPTQPLRTEKDVDLALEKFIAREQEALVSVSQVGDHPLLVRSIDKDDKLVKLLNVSSTCRRQDMPNYYRVNGCIYINKVNELDESTSFNDNNVPFIMEKSHSVDIDSYEDLAMAKYLIREI